MRAWRRRRCWLGPAVGATRLARDTSNGRPSDTTTSGYQVLVSFLVIGRREYAVTVVVETTVYAQTARNPDLFYAGLGGSDWSTMTDESTPATGTDDDEKATGYETITVRRDGDLGTPPQEREQPDMRGPEHFGWGGDLRVPAWDEVREQIDTDDYDAHTEVARIYYDLDEWDYRVEFLVDVEIEDVERERWGVERWQQLREDLKRVFGRV